MCVSDSVCVCVREREGVCVIVCVHSIFPVVQTYINIFVHIRIKRNFQYVRRRNGWKGREGYYWEPLQQGVQSKHRLSKVRLG